MNWEMLCIFWCDCATVIAAASHDAVIRVYDDAGNRIETHEHAGEFKEW